jgi:hypothetical protein
MRVVEGHLAVRRLQDDVGVEAAGAVRIPHLDGQAEGVVAMVR